MKKTRYHVNPAVQKWYESLSAQLLSPCSGAAEPVRCTGVDSYCPDAERSRFYFSAAAISNVTGFQRMFRLYGQPYSARDSPAEPAGLSKHFARGFRGLLS